MSITAEPAPGVQPVDGSLSPSRVADFKACPLLYRFRTVDRLPEEPSSAAARGTLVHKVLEDLFDLPAVERTPQRAAAMLPGTWARLASEDPALGGLFGATGSATDELERWLASCDEVLARYFTLEDPRSLEPAERELYVETVLERDAADGSHRRLALRGIIDRLDVADDGALRVVDYKTGRSPGVGFEGGALFQLRFYGLVLWRTHGVVPKRLQLVYLGDGTIVGWEPDEDDLRAVERHLHAVWEAVDLATRTGDWQPNPGRMCRWCSFQRLCPAFGGTPPPLPDPVEGAGSGQPAVSSG